MSKLTQEQRYSIVAIISGYRHREPRTGMLEEAVGDVEAILGMEAPASAPVEQPAQSGASEEAVKEGLARLAAKTEGEARALVEVISCRLGFGHVADYAPQDRPQAPMPTPQPVPLVERMRDCLWFAEQAPANWRHLVTAALNVALGERDAEWEKVIDVAYREQLSESGHGIVTFMKRVRSRLLAPAAPFERVTVTFYDAEPTPYWQVSLDGKHIGPCFPVTSAQVDAERYAADLRAKLADQARAAGGGKK